MAVALNAVYRRIRAAAQAAVIARANNLDGKMIPGRHRGTLVWQRASPEGSACKDWLQTVDRPWDTIRPTAYLPAKMDRLRLI
jgi:hypothetical protein